MAKLHDMTDKQAKKYLKEAGCTCKQPVLFHRPKVGPRCLNCGTQVVMVHRGGVARND